MLRIIERIDGESIQTMTEDTIKEIMRKAFTKHGFDMDKDCTCKDCECSKKCPFAWDLYNTNGDCLASK